MLELGPINELIYSCQVIPCRVRVMQSDWHENGNGVGLHAKYTIFADIVRVMTLDDDPPDIRCQVSDVIELKEFFRVATHVSSHSN